MGQQRIRHIELRFKQIKLALLEIGPMRPRSLTRQFKDPQHRVGAYWQISYTRRMKSRTEYVRKEWVKELRRQIATHKRFKRLIDQWIDLSIEHSQLTMQSTKPKANFRCRESRPEPGIGNAQSYRSAVMGSAAAARRAGIIAARTEVRHQKLDGRGNQ
jgi:hypothetical protein